MVFKDECDYKENNQRGEKISSKDRLIWCWVMKWTFGLYVSGQIVH